MNQRSHRLTYCPPLDGLRFISFFLVFMFHADTKVFWFGAMGPAIFFAISGFLITRLLLQVEAGDYRGIARFWIRRALRLVPAYYLVLTLGVLFSSVMYPVWQYLYLLNVKIYLTPMKEMVSHLLVWRDTGIHFWTLCVEEQFYLLFPIVLCFVPVAKRIYVIGGLLLVSWAFQYGMSEPRPFTPYGAMLPIAGEFILFGALFAALTEQKRFRLQALFEKWASWILIITLGLIVIRYLNMDFRAPAHMWQFFPMPYQTVLAFLLGLLATATWYLKSGPFHWILTRPPMIYLGKISYGLYLIHLFSWGLSDWLLGNMLKDQFWMLTAIRLGMTIGLASLMYHVLEAPLLKLKDRFR